MTARYIIVIIYFPKYQHALVINIQDGLGLSTGSWQCVRQSQFLPPPLMPGYLLQY